MPALAVAPEPVSAPPPSPQESVVLPAMRGDLIITKQLFEGRTYYVVKDPISLQYFRMSAEDYYLATLFDGKRNFGQIRDSYAARFPHVRLEYTPAELNERVLRFANDLALLQFLQVQGSRLKARYEAARKNKAKKGVFYNFVNTVFFSRFSVYDPDKLFGRMAKPIGWIWTRSSLWISCAILATAILVFGMNVGRIHPTMANFFSFSNLTLIWVTTIIIKSIHELGHGLTCKHFGGEVHEIGVMVLVFTPYFFVNVSDSWVMPERRHRILVSAAGIYVELILASFATFLWAVVQPGAFQDFLFNVMVIASFSTIVFNANPLMRFDGYYIMTDAIEVPNLQAKSRALITMQVKNLIFGTKAEDPVLARMPLPKKRFALFYTYAILSWIYGYYVIYKLTWFMSDRMAVYDMRAVGQFLSFSALLAWVVMPLWAFYKSLQLKREDWKPHGRLRRLSAIFGTALGAFLIMCFVPTELTITRSGAIELASPEQIRPEVPGFVEEIYVKEGEHVQPGQPIAKLSNRELQQLHVANEQRLRSAEAIAQRAIALDKPADLRQAEGARVAYQAKFDESVRDMGKLILKARTAGTVLTRKLDEKQGHLLRSGELFCEIGSLDPMTIKMALSEKQVRYVEQGQKVVLKADAYPNQTIHGVITEVHPMFLAKDLPAALSARRSGDVPTILDARGQEVPLERTFEARIDVENPEGLLRPGMTGHGKIFAGKRPWGKLVLQSLLDLISLDYRF
ncbi:efflux RND transporter periplasmic adaptor subunit [Verrucomicrobiota bacterium sgz303538]